MDLADVRDLAVVVAGIMYALMTLILLAVAAVVLFFGRRGMRALHGLVESKVVPALGRAQAVAEQMQARTAKLPGAPGSDAGVIELAETVGELRAAKPPFRSRRRTWLPFFG